MFKTFKGKIMFFTLTVLVIFNLGLLNVVNNILFSNLKDNIKGDMINIKNVMISTLKNNENNENLELDVNTLQDVYNGIKGYGALYDSTGNVISFKGEKANKDLINKVLEESMNYKSLLNYNNDNRLITTYIYPIYNEGNFKYNLVVQEEYAIEYEELNSTVSKIAVVQVSLFLFVALVLNSLVDKIVEPLKRLKDEMRKYGKGKDVEDLVVFSKDEVGEVTQSFNQMKREKDELQHSTREFFNNATHELKTPVTSIYAYLQILKGEEYESIDKEFRERAFDRMSLECIKLKELIQKILDVSRGSINRKREKEVFYVNEVIEDITDSLLIRCQRFSKDINLFLDSVEIKAVKSDVEEIILNLLDNAIKYSAASDINVSLKKYENLKNTMILEVKNKTRHIPENISSKLLEPFVKYNNGNGKSAQEISSSGLGLYLCLNLAEANGISFTYKIEDENIIFTLILNEELILEKK